MLSGIRSNRENTINNVVSDTCNTMYIHTSDSIGGSPPASNKRTFQLGFSDNREATTDPADPAPTTMKS